MKKKLSKPEWLECFYEFLGGMTISSKELDSIKPVPLLDVLYSAQHRFLEEIASGLQDGVRSFHCLKSRQLGISTISLAIDVFWASVHDKLQGAIITDTDGNRDKFRILLEQYIQSLPRGLRVGIKQHNRNNLVLHNGSVIDYLVAGTRGKKGSLGTSRALNFVHATEVSNWGSTQADIANLKASLAQKHPHRLYIWESTARGFGNEWYDMCQGALQDDTTQKLFFLGWFLKEDYAFAQGTPEFIRWWDGEETEEEQEISHAVKSESNWVIKPEQWAWHRYMRTVEIIDPDLMRQNYPSTATEAFIMTGRSFFPLRRVTQNIRLVHEESVPLKAYRYHIGNRFDATELEQLDSTANADLRIWEEPHPHGVYVMGVDTAFGREDKDRHAIEVFRCFADRVVQVAEFATGVPETYQAAWVMAHLAGAYRNVIINLEVSGPGFAVMDELRHLRQLLDMRMLPGLSTNNNNFEDIFGAVRWFLYHRPDSMGSGYVYNWKGLKLDTKLPTPTGWTTMNDVQVGDKLIDDMGNQCSVTFITPVQINKQCYEVVFDDGTVIVADNVHQWSVHRHHPKWKCGRESIRSTDKLLPGKHVIRVAKEMFLPGIELPIHPYVLGCWLGNGLTQGEVIYHHAKDIDEVRDKISALGYEVGSIRQERSDSLGRNFRVVGLSDLLKNNDLIGNKHIPDEYLRSSPSQRLGLLQGLMDTDGGACSNKSRQCHFTTTNRGIADGFIELLRTLGLKAKFCIRNRILEYGGGQRECAPAWQFWFAAGGRQVFGLTRKQQVIDGARGEARKTWHRIKSVTPINSVPVKCIAVDSPSRLYLAGEGMIPTHNTNQDNKLQIMNELRDTYAVNHADIFSVPLLEEMERVVQEGSEIRAEGRAHDDRVFASALAIHAWITWVRGSLISTEQTYERVKRDEELDKKSPNANLIANVVSSFFREQQEKRAEKEEADAWAGLEE